MIVLTPLFAILLASFRPATEVFRKGLNLNIDLPVMSFDNYMCLFTGKEGYFSWFGNSVLLTVVQTACTLIVSSFVGYGFATYQFKGKNLIFGCVLLVMMVPLEIIILPLFQLFMGIKAITGVALIDSYAGIILPFVAQAMPIFFFRQYMSGLPHDFVDAGRVDGCSEYGIFFRIMMPLAVPSFAAMGILVGYEQLERLPVAPHCDPFAEQDDPAAGACVAPVALWQQLRDPAGRFGDGDHPRAGAVPKLPAVFHRGHDGGRRQGINTAPSGGFS